MKDTNPDHYKVDGADFVKFMNDPQIKGFGDWMFANGFNAGELYINRWISVKERLPEEDEDVLAYNGAYMFIAAYTTNPTKYWYTISGDRILTTHWMPLPEPPKEI